MSRAPQARGEAGGPNAQGGAAQLSSAPRVVGVGL